MPISLLFWILMLLWLVLDVWYAWPTFRPPSLLLFLVIALLGWKVFGPALHG